MTETHGPPDEGDLGYASVRNYLLYGLSLPERALRSAAGVISGAVRESAALLVPQAFQNAATYQMLIRRTLDFLAEDVGGVAPRQDPNSPAKIENYVARKAVGNFLELAGLATLHLSPALVLAVIGDLAYGSKVYLRQLAEELKQQGVIAQDSTINNIDDLLGALGELASTAATTLDTPPLSLDGLKQTVQQTRKAVESVDVTKVIPQAELNRMWEEIHRIAASQEVDPLAVSSAMTLFVLDKIGTAVNGALSSVRAAGTILDRCVFDHYRTALGAIEQKGIFAVLAHTAQPYVEAVWLNFASSRPTLTEELLSGRMLGRGVSALRRWLLGG